MLHFTLSGFLWRKSAASHAHAITPTHLSEPTQLTHMICMATIKETNKRANSRNEENKSFSCSAKDLKCDNALCTQSIRMQANLISSFNFNYNFRAFHAKCRLTVLRCSLHSAHINYYHPRASYTRICWKFTFSWWMSNAMNKVNTSWAFVKCRLMSERYIFAFVIMPLQTNETVRMFSYSKIPKLTTSNSGWIL